MSERVDKLLARLRKGGDKTLGIFGSLGPAQWGVVLYEEPYPWTARDLLVHFVSAEDALLQAAQNIAAGGPGAPEGFDYDAFNADEQKRLADVSPEQLLADMQAARQRTIEWLAGLQEADMDRVGRHPALGEITLEDFVNVIYGHQLMHMRELMPLLD
jgi:hypothetical protein